MSPSHLWLRGRHHAGLEDPYRSMYGYAHGAPNTRVPRVPPVRRRAASGLLDDIHGSSRRDVADGEIPTTGEASDFPWSRTARECQGRPA